MYSRKRNTRRYNIIIWAKSFEIVFRVSAFFFRHSSGFIQSYIIHLYIVYYMRIFFFSSKDETFFPSRRRRRRPGSPVNLAPVRSKAETIYNIVEQYCRVISTLYRFGVTTVVGIKLLPPPPGEMSLD